MKIRYILEEKGRLLPADQLLKREAKGWAGTLQQAFKECDDSGKQFFSEVDQGLTDFAKELGGIDKRKSNAANKGMTS